jgi:hypothetical protein
MAVVPNGPAHVPLDLGYLEYDYSLKAVCAIPIVGDLLSIPIRAKLANLDYSNTNNPLHRMQISYELAGFALSNLVRSYFSVCSFPGLLFSMPASPLIVISLIGASILLNNVHTIVHARCHSENCMKAMILISSLLNLVFVGLPLTRSFILKDMLLLRQTFALGAPVSLMLTNTILYSCILHVRRADVITYHTTRLRNILSLPLQGPVQQQNPYQPLVNRDAERGSLQDALSFWSRYLPVEQEPLPSAALLQFDVDTRAPNQRYFQIFLNRLQETADFAQASTQNQQNFALRVASIVRDMAASKEFCDKAITAVENAIIACEDRVAKGFNDLEVLSLQYGRNKPQTAIETAFLAVRLARLDQVQRKAIELNQGPEGLETVLFLELALKDRLQLPLQTQNMRYSGIGSVNDDVVYRTAREILDATSTNDQVCEILIASSVWTDFLQREHAVFVDDVMGGFQIIAREGGTDYPANLADLEQNPNRDWTEFLDRVGPLNISPEDRKALQEEVLQTLRAACNSLIGIEYASALSQLIRQIHRTKTTEWFNANCRDLRAKLR